VRGLRLASRPRQHRLIFLLFGNERVGFFHQHENLLFESVLLDLAGRDFVRERLILLIRLDGGLVILESRQARLDGRDIFFEQFARVMILLDPRLGGLERTSSLRKVGRDRLLGRGKLRQPLARGVNGGVNLLESFDGCERRKHEGSVSSAESCCGRYTTIAIVLGP
jgi:hypothetical protein